MIERKNRRIFLKELCSMSAFASGSLLLTHCATPAKSPAKTTAVPSAKVNPCDDLTGVDKTDVEKRKALGYVNLSPTPDKQCDECKLWIPVPEGKECGGCLLFTGPVSPEGNCTYWAPKV